MSLYAILSNYSSALWAGLLVTLELCLAIWFLSFAFGGLLGVTAARSFAVGFPLRVLAAFLAGVPAIVFLFWMHYPAQELLDVIVNPLITAVVALSILGSFMVAESVRQTLVDFPQQYVIAAKVSGLTSRETFWKIVVPIVLRSILPNGLFIMVALFQMSLFASLISVDEIFRVAQRINSVVYRPVEIYTALALFCVAVSLPLHVAAHVLRARLTRDLSER